MKKMIFFLLILLAGSFLASTTMASPSDNGVIYARFFEDVNRSGQWDSGEDPIENVGMFLDPFTCFTEGGECMFDMLSSGEHKLDFDPAQTTLDPYDLIAFGCTGENPYNNFAGCDFSKVQQGEIAIDIDEGDIVYVNMGFVETRPQLDATVYGRLCRDNVVENQVCDDEVEPDISDRTEMNNEFDPAIICNVNVGCSTSDIGEVWWDSLQAGQYKVSLDLSQPEFDDVVLDAITCSVAIADEIPCLEVNKAEGFAVIEVNPSQHDRFIVNFLFVDKPTANTPTPSPTATPSPTLVPTTGPGPVTPPPTPTPSPSPTGTATPTPEPTDEPVTLNHEYYLPIMFGD